MHFNCTVATTVETRAKGYVVSSFEDVSFFIYVIGDLIGMKVRGGNYSVEYKVNRDTRYGNVFRLFARALFEFFLA